MGEVQRGLSRFWGMPWKWKGPILGLLALVVIGIASSGGGGDDDPDTVQAGASSTEPTNTPRPGDTPKPTNTPKATETPRPPTPTPEPAGFSFGSGKKVVGSDLVAGVTYRTREASRACYWERLSGLGGTLGEIIDNDNTDGPAVVTIGANDIAFNSARCARWTQDLSPITSDPNAPFPGEGTYIVGVDISPGTWRTSGATRCYWEREAAFDGEIQSIIANDNSDGDTIVTIGPADKGFKSARCGTWTKQ